MMFSKLSNKISSWTGSGKAFLIALVSIVLWAILGPLFHFSDTWQLLANTVTTLVTFLMCFLIQSNQNRTTNGIILKLDELIRAMETARNEFIGTEDLTDAEIEAQLKQFKNEI